MDKIDLRSKIVLPNQSGCIFDKVSDFLLQNEKPDTLIHSKNVAHTCSEIAGMYGLDITLCETASYLHDISAVIPPALMLEYAVQNGWLIDEAEKRHPFLLHQKISCVLAFGIFGISDKIILDAVSCHTTLRPECNKYDMALFIADKLSWDKEGIPPFYDIVSNALKTSLYKASLAYIDYIVDHNIILYPHKMLTSAREWLGMYI